MSNILRNLFLGKAIKSRIMPIKTKPNDFCEDDIDYLKKQIELLDEENTRLRNDNEILAKTIQIKEKIDPKTLDLSEKITNQQNIIKFKDSQIANLEKDLKYHKETIHSLQENMIQSQVHKIPQYQKTIKFLNETVRKLQEEVEFWKQKSLQAKEI